MSYFRKTIISNDKILQSYVIGLAIGDGNLSNPNGRATRLRISCDKKYPFLINKIESTLRKLLPSNKVNKIMRKDNCIDVYVYSNHLENLLGWKADRGSKIRQNISVPKWIKKRKKYCVECLRGLIETDGSIYTDRKYKMVIFSTRISNLSKDVIEIIRFLGFEPKLYKITENGNTVKYQIRLSKNVENFVQLINPEKTPCSEKTS